MEEHALDDHHRIGRDVLVQWGDDCIGAVIEEPAPDSSVTTRSEWVQDVSDEGIEVVGVAEEALR